MVSDSFSGRVVRFDVDDDLAQAARVCEEKVATQFTRIDSEREAALRRLSREREHRQWLEQFRAARLAEQNAERPPPDLEAAAAAAARRINEQWRPKS